MAIGALEPWMSGIGGVGFMTIWSAKEKRAWTVDYGPISARKLDLSHYKIVGPGPANPFAWPDIHEPEQRGRLPLDRRARHGRRPRQGARALRHAEMEGRAGARRRARRARHGARLVHAGDDRQRRRAPVEVPGVEGQPTCATTAACRPTTGRAPRATSSSAISAQTMRRLADGGPREYLRGQPGARHRGRPAGRRLGDLLRRPRLLPGAHRRAAVLRASRRHHQRRGRPDRRPDLAPHARARRRAHQGQGRARRRLLRRDRRGHAHRLSSSASRRWATSPTTPAPRISAPPTPKATWWR